METATKQKPEAYGEQGLGLLERLGVSLRTRAVRRHVARTRPARLLDIGCGYDAGLVRMLLPDVSHATGIDLKVSASAKALANTTFLEGWIDETLESIEPGSFDLVTILSVLEHLEDPARTLNECHRVLAPGGHLIVHVPTWRGKRVLEFIAFRFGIAADSIDDHKMYYSVEDLWPLLVDAGFRPQQIRSKYHTAGCSLRAVARRE